MIRTTTYIQPSAKANLLKKLVSLIFFAFISISIFSQTLYSYQSGQWGQASTWTTDPSGTLYVNPTSLIPTGTSAVVILDGRTVTTSGNGRQSSTLEIQEGATLDLATDNGHNFGTVSGKGTLRISMANYFPNGTYTAFVSSNGGTVEYNNSSNFTLSSAQPVYNNLIINLSTSAISGNVTMSNLTINGTFTVQKGTFMIGQNAAYAGDGRITIDIKKDVVVSTNGSIMVGLASTNNSNLPAGFTGVKPYSTTVPPSGYETGVLVPRYYDIYHKVYIGGNLINNGSVKFISSAITIPNYTALTSSGAATVRFYGLNSANLTCNGQTDFYNLILDKGSDQTYSLTVDAAATSNFRLFGRNEWSGGGGADANNPELDKALWIKNGTLRLTGYVTIPSLSEGNCGGTGTPNSDFYIPLNGALLIDGPNVTVLSTADRYQEVNAAYGLNQASNTYNINTNAGCSSFSIYGKFQMNSGFMSTRESGGFIFWTNANGVFIQNGGFIDAKQLRSADGGSGVASYIQNGGTLQLRGRYTIDGTGISNTVTQIQNAPVNYGTTNGGGLGTSYGTFNIYDANDLFTMTGGTMNILDDCADNGRIFDVRSNAQNNTVTGGTININTYNNTNYYIYTTSPIQNLNLTRLNGTATVLQGTALVINNTLSLSANSILNAQNNDLTIGGNFSLNSGCTYTPGTNNTILNGNGGQVFTNTGTITTGLYNMTLSNASNTTISNNLTVRNDLTINTGCNLSDQGMTISVAGNAYNNGVHSSQANGSITLTGGGNPTIIGGNGNGIFGNLTLNKSAGYTSFAANQTLTGDLRLGTNGLLDINIYKLALSAQSEVYDAVTGTTTTGFSGTKMVRTSGLQSDGGFSKTYNSTNSFVFPLGTVSDYTPAAIQFAIAPSTYGSVNVKPVAHFQPFASSTNSLDYYWKITSTGFTGIKPASIHHTYTYVDADWTGRGNIVNYVPGVYNPVTWTYVNDVAQVADATNNILFTNVGYLDGDFTAGQTDAFGNVVTYYSRASGDWSNGNTWSTDPVLKWDGLAAGSFPGASNPVVIGDGVTHNHTIVVGTNARRSGTLQINNNSVLDLGTTTNHDFGALLPAITGNGTLRISSATATASFPAGDFGSFLGNNGGTVEYYTTGAVDFTIPTISNYWNFNSNPSTGRTITMPNINLGIYHNLTILGAGLTNLNSAASRTLTVEGSINVSSATLRFINNQPQTMIVKKDISIGATGRFDVSTAGTAVANTLTVFGNLTNNGVFDMNPDNTRYCDVTFSSATNNVVTGTGTTTDFNRLTIDKGTSRNSVLNVTGSSFSLTNNTLATSLFLPNGTFRLTSPLAITLSTSGSFSIPSSGCLSANGGTINIGTAASNTGDLLLAGQLEVLAGNVNIGVAANNNNNDIEYASAGSPEIIVQGGNLFVNGQIRRNTSNTLGSLIYNQSGGTVTINGQSQNATRAKLEITNDGSNFTMSGGNIILVRAGGTTYGDLYITPEFNNITGGNIQLGNTSTPASQIFYVNSSSPLWSVTVDGTTNSKTLNLQVNNLILKNSLSINGNSVFLANGLNVNIGGNLTNQNPTNTAGLSNGGYQPGSSTQLTTFDGLLNNQTISGIAGNLTNFATVEIKNSFSPGRVSVANNTSIRVNNDLKLTSGILNDGGNTITIIGNVYNAAIHESPSGNGILLAGPARQEISGSGYGQFGNVIINNLNDIYLLDNIIINNNLTFTGGNLYINDYLLTFGQNATITGAAAGPPTRMIMLNGALSDVGVKKVYPASASSFTFPIGIAGKFTPVTINLTSNTAAGNIIVKPVNFEHPSLQNVPGDELKYYWSVVSAGFGAITATQTFNYINSDITGTETNYVTGRYFGGNWVPTGGIAGTVNAAANTITLTGINYIDGEYTAGETANFASMPTFYSRNATLGGDWDTPASWSTTGYGGIAATSVPNGNKVMIAAGHTITVSANSKKAYSIDLYGSLNLVTSVYHSFGHVIGNGTIRITSTSANFFVFPGGNYDVFMNTVGSIVEFTNNNASPASLPVEIGHVYKPFQNVIFSGTGVKALSSKNMKVRGNLIITAGTLSNSQTNKNIYLLGNWNDNVANGFIPGSGLVSFEGTSPQQINAVATEGFYNLQVNNSTGVTLNKAVNVNNLLYLVSGTLNTSASNILTLTNSNPYAAIGGSSASFVNGPMAKVISNGSFFNFPVGKGSRFGNVFISNTAPGMQTWVAEYFNSNPLGVGMDPAAKLTPIDVVSDNEYWRLNGAASTQATVRVRWDNLSGLVPPDAFTRNQKMRIVEWNGTAWQNRGGVINDGGATSGTVQSSSSLNLAGNHFYTLGIESLPTATITSGASNLCNNGSNANISVALTGVAPWTIKYKINGANETTISNIGSSPFNIVANSTDLSSLGGGPNYIFTISYISDASASVGTRDFITSAIVTLLAAPAPVIAGKAIVSQNETGVTYSVSSFSGRTYNWTVSGATSFSGQGTNQITANWGAGTTGTVSVTETLTATGCSTIASQGIVINLAPTPSVIGNNSVCDQANEIYSTASAVGHTFNWTVNGGIILLGQGTNQITVHWNLPGVRTVTVRETITATSAFADNTLSVDEHALPSNTLVVSDPITCIGSSANIIVQGGEAGSDYTLRLNPANTVVTNVHNGSAGDVTFTVNPAVSTTYNVYATNEYGCSMQLTDLSTVTVNVVPAIGLVNSINSLILK